MLQQNKCIGCVSINREKGKLSVLLKLTGGTNAHELFCQHLMFKNAVMKNLGKYLVKAHSHRNQTKLKDTEASLKGFQ